MDPETTLVDHVYLGCTQRESKPPKSVVRAKQELFAKLMSNQAKGSDPEAGGETAFLSKLLSSKLPERASKGKTEEDSGVHPSVLKPSLTYDEYDLIKGWDLDMSGHAESVLKGTAS